MEVEQPIAPQETRNTSSRWISLLPGESRKTLIRWISLLPDDTQQVLYSLDQSVAR